MPQTETRPKVLPQRNNQKQKQDIFVVKVGAKI